jgi:hypothetical protein
MARTNPFSITYGGRQVGGSTVYQLFGPYVFDKSFTNLRLVFDVLITADTVANLKTYSDNLQTDFSKRLTDAQTLVIDLDGNSWTYTMGTTLLNAEASIAKTGNEETDRGRSRMYTVTIEAELPADDNGLRDVKVHVEMEPSRRKVVTMKGVYTADSDADAKENYQTNFDAEATNFLAAIDAAANWELVNEDYSLDRQMDVYDDPYPHTCEFARQYVELLYPQGTTTDVAAIRDHRVIFSNMRQHPGDSTESVKRLQRVVATYDCSVDVDQSTDLHSVFENTVKSNIKTNFVSEFSPSVYAVEEQRVSYDETNNRISAMMQFIFQPSGGGEILEGTSSLTYRENRALDYTPVHGESELSFAVDAGWLTMERLFERTVVYKGNVTPQYRLSSPSGAGSGGKAGSVGSIRVGPGQMPSGLFGRAGGGMFGRTFGHSSGAPSTSIKWGDAGYKGGGGNLGAGGSVGDFPSTSETMQVNAEGWNTIANQSRAETLWIGDPGEQQMQVTVVSETLMQRYSVVPKGLGAGPGGPGTGG